VSASRDQTLRLWDLESGKTIRMFEGHSGAVNAVAVTLDGRLAVSASDDQTLRLWDLESGQTLRTLQGHTKFVSAVAVTLDGRRAVSASWHTLQLWDLESGEKIATFTGEDGMRSCAVTSDGRTIISNDASGRVHLLRLVEADTNQASNRRYKDPAPAPQGV
jgi:WD40 repeat protein